MGHADIATTAEFYNTARDEHTAHAQWFTQAMTLVASKNRNDAEMRPTPKIGVIRHVG